MADNTIWQPKVKPTVTKQWWEYPLDGVNNVFDWLHTNVEEPTGAVLTSPFTPATKGTQGMNWLQREQAEYKSWKEPQWKTGIQKPKFLGGGELTIGVKGAVEQLPWFAGTIATGGSGLLGKVVQSGGKLAGAAKIGQAALKPIVAAETIANLPAQKSLEWLTGMIKGAKKAQNVLTPIRKAEQSAKIGAYSEQVARSEGLAGLQEAKAALKGEYTKPNFETLTPISEAELKTNVDNIAGLIKNLTMNDWHRIDLGDAIEKIMLKQVPQPAEIDKIEKYLSPQLASALRDVGKSIPMKVFDTAIDAMNGTRAILTGFDVSGLGRQGLVALVRHPSMIPGAVKNYAKALFSEKNAKLIDDMIKNDPDYIDAVKKGFDIGVTVRGGKAYSEENFMSNIARKIPGIVASERGYTTGLNFVRLQNYKMGKKLFEKLGATDLDYKELATLTRVITGRGDLPKFFKGSSPVLNALLFSPKLLFSRLQLPTLLFSPSPLVRAEAARTIVQFLAFGSSVLGMAKMAGGSIGLDPRSADFGKMKFGDTRLDVWTGYIQYARFLAQLTTGQTKTVGGNVVEANRAETIMRFLQSKASPAAGLIVDLLKGETYMGEDIFKAENIPSQLYNRLAPLALQDLISAMNEEGFPNGLIALPGFGGVGVVTYEDQVRQAQEKAAAKQYNMSWDEVGKQYGNIAQRKLEKSDMNLAKNMAEKDIKNEGTVWNNWRSEGKDIETAYQNSITMASNEYNQTKDGLNFRDKVTNAALVRREEYNLRDNKKIYQSVVQSVTKPLSEEAKKKMNPMDVARNEYYTMMYSPEMTDEFGNYNFEQADEVRSYITQKYGDEALKYVEDYMGIKWDAPTVFNELQSAKKILAPMWAVQTQIEKRFGQFFAESKRGKALVTKMRQQMRKTNPQMERAYQLFYANQG
jgi:hypothetical protein